MRRQVFLFTVMILVVYCSASGRTWYILPDGTGDAPTIQAGVDSASAGDTVLVACGIYHDCTHPDPDSWLNCVIMKSGICLRSETGDADCVTIDAEGEGRVFYCGGVDSSTHLEGFTLIGGLADGSGYAMRGGGMYCTDSSPGITGCVFSGNRAASEGGALYLGNGSSPAITGCTFSSNDSWGAGGAIYCDSGGPTIADCSFTRNEADYGGGICHIYSSPTITGCSFSGHLAWYEGGGVLSLVSSPTIRDCVFSDNVSDYFWGGGISFVSSNASVASCVFSGNLSQEYGGGVFCDHSADTISNCLFVDNYGSQGGGGMGCFAVPSPVVRNCTFWRNEANRAGGGFRSESSHPRLTNCTFVGNRATGAGAIHCWGRTTTIENTIIAFSASGSSIECSHDCEVSLTCCDVYGNAGGDWVGCIADQHGINGNFSACPSFCNADDGDFRLCDESPCLPGNHPDGYDCGLIGAWGEGCACGPSQTMPTTWGAIKSMYR